MKCKTCGHETEDVKTIIDNNVEYDIETTQLGVEWRKIELPKGKRKWTYEECVKLFNNKKLRKQLKLDDCWFFIESYLDKFPVVWFNADSDGANLYCFRNPQYSNSSLGVRFAREISKNRIRRKK